MDCSCEDGSSIYIVKLIVSHFAHIVIVVHASINTKRCRIGRWEKERTVEVNVNKKEFD